MTIKRHWAFSRCRRGYFAPEVLFITMTELMTWNGATVHERDRIILASLRLQPRR